MNKIIDYNKKVKSIQKAINKGQVFKCANRIITSINESWAITGKDWMQRSWMICSTHINKWFKEIAE